MSCRGSPGRHKRRASASADRAAPPRASDGRWYLLGRDLERDDWRLFSANPVRPRVPHGAPFAPRVVPGGDVDAFVSARFKGADTNKWPCRGAVLLYAPARDVLPFAGDGTVIAIDDERCTLVAGVMAVGCARRVIRAVRGGMEAELVRGDVVGAVRRLEDRQGRGRGIALGGAQLPATLAGQGLIDEYTFVVYPVVAGWGLRLLDGVDMRLELVEQRIFRSGATVQRYRPVR